MSYLKLFGCIKTTPEKGSDKTKEYKFAKEDAHPSS